MSGYPIYLLQLVSQHFEYNKCLTPLEVHNSRRIYLLFLWRTDRYHIYSTRICLPVSSCKTFCCLPIGPFVGDLFIVLVHVEGCSGVGFDELSCNCIYWVWAAGLISLLWCMVLLLQSVCCMLCYLLASYLLYDDQVGGTACWSRYIRITS